MKEASKATEKAAKKGKKAEKKQAAQREQMEAAAQVVSMLVIDKKKIQLKNEIEKYKNEISKI